MRTSWFPGQKKKTWVLIQQIYINIFKSSSEFIFKNTMSPSQKREGLLALSWAVEQVVVWCWARFVSLYTRHSKLQRDPLYIILELVNHSFASSQMSSLIVITWAADVTQVGSGRKRDLSL